MGTTRAHTLHRIETGRGIGPAIYAYRKARGLSVTALAKEAGVSEKTLNNVLRGRHSPRLETLALIAAALGVDVVDLLHSAATAA
jgi:transcriptional regulator with XRE-family HTH domain